MAPTKVSSTAAAAFTLELERLFTQHKEAVAVDASEFEAGRYALNLQSEILKLDTGDAGSEITLERIVEDANVPSDFDIDTVLIIDEQETLLATTFYVTNRGTVEIHVSYNGFTADGFPLEVFSGLADDKTLSAVRQKLRRAVPLFPEGDRPSPAKPKAAKKSKRTPRTAARIIVDDK